MPSLNCEQYASCDTHFSNSLIIHDVVTQPERLILVRWISLETQWKTSWEPHVFGDDFKPLCKIFLNLHIQRARRTHEDEKLSLIPVTIHFRASFTANIKCNSIKVLKINNDKCHIKQHHCTFCPKHRSRGLKSNFSFFSSMKRHISFSHTLVKCFGWISFLWRFGNFSDRITSASKG